MFLTGEMFCFLPGKEKQGIDAYKKLHEKGGGAFGTMLCFGPLLEPFDRRITHGAILKRDKPEQDSAFLTDKGAVELTMQFWESLSFMDSFHVIFDEDETLKKMNGSLERYSKLLVDPYVEKAKNDSMLGRVMDEFGMRNMASGRPPLRFIEARWLNKWNYRFQEARHGADYAYAARPPNWNG